MICFDLSLQRGFLDSILSNAATVLLYIVVRGVDILIFQLSVGTNTVCFTAAGSDMVIKHQQIQTEVAETVDQHVQAGSTAKQQGLCVDTMCILTCNNCQHVHMKRCC